MPNWELLYPGCEVIRDGGRWLVKWGDEIVAVAVKRLSQRKAYWVIWDSVLGFQITTEG